MKQTRINELPDVTGGHWLSGVLPGTYLTVGGMGFKERGMRTHADSRHIHDDCEAFVLLQGKAQMEIDGVLHPMQTGDILIVEPGEEHHLISDPDDPCVNLWMHAGPHRNENQT